MVMPTRSIFNFVEDLCAQLGFAACGITPAAPIAYQHELAEWLADKKHGEMAYLENHLPLRIDPAVMLDGCQSIIAVADRYAGSDRDVHDLTNGRVARYARGDDYHASMKKRLQSLADRMRAEFPDETFRAAVDTAPIMEREHAARAGLGYVGKNTLLIQPGVGSYFFIGEILTTLEIQTTPTPLADHCGTCTKCIDECPTDAITPYSVDARKCISYLTIEHRNLIDEQFHAPMGEWIFGCDICQEVCPHNGDTAATAAATINPSYTARRTGLDLLKILGWTLEDRQAAFKKSSMKRAKMHMMKRNAIIASANAVQHPEVDPRWKKQAIALITQLASDRTEDPVVCETASSVLGKLNTD